METPYMELAQTVEHALPTLIAVTMVIAITMATLHKTIVSMETVSTYL